MRWWLFRKRPAKEPEITPAEFAEMWIDANRKAQQRFYDFLAERGAMPSEEQLAADQARMREVTREAQNYVCTHI